MVARPRSSLLRALVGAVVVLLATPAAARHRHRPRTAPSAVVLDGVVVPVRWTDGDTFRVLEGRYGGRSARLQGYNTLESYGPVHRWGGWTGPELLANAREATAIARGGRWTCTTGGQRDGYGRVLVACPDAAAALVRSGHAMVFAVDAPADPALLELQRRAQQEGAGMWSRGVPPGIVSSVHSTAEGARRTYDRVVDTRTGDARRVPHQHAYRICEEVCAGTGAARSCMVYVPFERRYRRRPACLRP